LAGTNLYIWSNSHICVNNLPVVAPAMDQEPQNLKMGHVTLTTPSLGLFVIRGLVLAKLEDLSKSQEITTL